MSDCLFCKIVNQEIPTNIIAENENVLAFNDINPQAPVHVLIIPKEHIPTTLDLNENNYQVLSEMGKMANEISKDFELQEGYRWVVNTNKYGGQAVYHIHLHLLGGRQMSWPPG
ncbi:MAG: histidine triad nucleotide-binding protein [Candidatus Marinimicrobia bacterium]|nr:histidine triad nucleotide-binding protein [Candidatus Neomarinimicrobiota bacterium]